MEVLELYDRRTAEIQGDTKYWIAKGRSLLKALLPAVGEAYREFLSLDRVLFLTALYRAMDIGAKAKALEEYVFSLIDTEDVFKTMEENFINSLKAEDLKRPIEELYKIWREVNKDVALPERAISLHSYAVQNVVFFLS